ncbi:MAG: hypothetical protein IJU25_07460, partial [Lachnospiraceae bacterium]|nr:hypothetical protein [Lachnospiraceae bacterium]
PFPGEIYYQQEGSMGSYPDCYYIDAKGILQTGWKVFMGKKYYFNASGKMEFSDFYLNGKHYALNPDTDDPYLLSNTVRKDTEGNAIGFVQKDGTYMTGWIYVNGAGQVIKKAADAEFIYYADATGSVLQETNDLYCIGGKYYAVDKKHRIVRGWKYMESPGVVYLNPTRNVKYYPGGKFAFYCDPATGEILSGWQSLQRKPSVKDGALLVFENKDLRTVFCEEPVKLYFYPDQNDAHPYGALALSDSVSVAGTLYSFKADGTLHTGEGGWLDVARTSFRMDDGKLACERAQIDDGTFYFDPKTGVKQKNCFRKTGKKWYYYDANGQETRRASFVTTSGAAISATYAADGSISALTYTADGKKAAGVAIKPGDEVMITDKNGLPLSGLVTYGGDSYFYDADGRPHNTGGLKTIMKIGKKYYLCQNGKMLSGVNKIGAFEESLSETDRMILGTYSNVISSLGGSMRCATAADGSVLSNAIADATHTNTYGVLLDDEDQVLFYRTGGKWYASTNAEPGSRNISFINNAEAKTVHAVIRYSANGLLQGVYGADGKALSGWFSYYAGSDPYQICLKNGKPATGKQTVEDPYGPKITMFFDADHGLRYDNAKL